MREIKNGKWEKGKWKVVILLPDVSALLKRGYIPVPRSSRPFWKKTFRRMKNQRDTVKKSGCLSAASLRIFSNVLIFQGFCKTGLALLVLLGQCQKYLDNLYLCFCLDTKGTKKSRPVRHLP
ncbi:MAG: hypothetical protein PHQ46_02065 [Negativicutes bacterium]|nr:hypothetical protein [Negativicutes bacterium]